MNRRTFFRSLLSAAACVVARAYAPGAMATEVGPRYVDKFVWDLKPLRLAPSWINDWMVAFPEGVGIRLALRDQLQETPGVRAWLDECAALINARLREQVRIPLL